MKSQNNDTTNSYEVIIRLVVITQQPRTLTHPKDVVIKTYFSENSTINDTRREINVWTKAYNTLSEKNFKERYPSRMVGDKT